MPAQMTSSLSSASTSTGAGRVRTVPPRSGGDSAAKGGSARSSSTACPPSTSSASSPSPSSVIADTLLFDDGDRGPDDDLRLQFEATSRLSSEEKRMVRELLDAILLKHEAKRWASSA